MVPLPKGNPEATLGPAALPAAALDLQALAADESEVLGDVDGGG